MNRPIVQRSKPWRSKKHLAKVREMPCCRCGNPHTEAHHLIGVARGSRGMGTKTPDSFAMALCSTCHRVVHSEPDLWQTQWVWMVSTLTMALDLSPEEIWERVARSLAAEIEGGQSDGDVLQ